MFSALYFSDGQVLIKGLRGECADLNARLNSRRQLCHQFQPLSEVPVLFDFTPLHQLLRLVAFDSTAITLRCCIAVVARQLCLIAVVVVVAATAEGKAQHLKEKQSGLRSWMPLL